MWFLTTRAGQGPRPAMREGRFSINIVTWRNFGVEGNEYKAEACIGKKRDSFFAVKVGSQYPSEALFRHQRNCGVVPGRTPTEAVKKALIVLMKKRGVGGKKRSVSG